jgi:hypothetical protein
VIEAMTGLRGHCESQSPLPYFSSPVSLLMIPLFPRSGSGESGFPMSAVILRRYDFPARIPGHLFVSLPGSTLPSSVRVWQLALAFPRSLVPKPIWRHFRHSTAKEHPWRDVDADHAPKRW